MANIVRIDRRGSQLYATFDDGTTTVFMPSTVGGWAPSKTAGGTTPPPVTPGGAGGITITGAMITAAVTSVGGSTSAMVDTADNIAAAFNAAIAKAAPGILTSKARAACLIGECAQETDWFKTLTEYGAGGHTYSPYDGRGFIQLTWRDNYAAFGQWMQGLGLLTDPNYFVNNPTQLAQLQYAAYTAIYYFNKSWNGQTLWQFCDASSTPWSQVSRAINTGSPYSTFPAGGETTRATAIDAVLAVTPDPAPPNTGGTGVQAALVKWCTDRVGAFFYTQDGAKRLDPLNSGGTDCSALMYVDYKLTANVLIGTWTGDQQNYGSIVIDVGGTYNESIMQPADLVFFNWQGPSTNFDHVEMYIGNNQCIGHGGPGAGPTIKTLSNQIAGAYNFRVRRYV